MTASDFFRIRLWAVIGPARSGKSSVIGALVSQTGQGSGGARHIRLRGDGWLYIHAFRQSVQEANQTPKVAAEKIVNAARASQKKSVIAYYNVLLALRSDVFNKLPTAEDYLAHFISIGWELQSLVLLEVDENEYNRYSRFGAPLAHLPYSASMTSVQLQRNWVFGAVRNHFGWA